MHRTPIDNCLRRAGVTQPRRPALSDVQPDQAEATYLKGDSWVTIAERFGLDPGTDRRNSINASILTPSRTASWRSRIAASRPSRPPKY